MHELLTGHNIPLPDSAPVVVIEGAPDSLLAEEGFPCAFLLGADNRAGSREDIIDADTPRQQDGAVIFDPGTRTFRFQLDQFPEAVAKISVCLLLWRGAGGGVALRAFQHLSTRISSVDGTVLARCPLETQDRGETALILVDLYRHKGKWKLRAVGQGFTYGATALARHFGLEIPDDTGGGQRQDDGYRPGSGSAGQDRRDGKPKTCCGTGFCISREGYFVTNHHVVEAAQRLRGTSPVAQFDLELVFADAHNDLALLRAKESAQHVAALHPGTTARLGETVVALGYPLSGLLGSNPHVTSGNLSALMGMHDDTRFLQFTAPVQPGNSGGPLLDASGRVVGVVEGGLSTLFLRGDSLTVSQNVNFAIKTALLRSFLEAVGIAYETAPQEHPRSAAEVAQKARHYVVRIEVER